MKIHRAMMFAILAALFALLPMIPNISEGQEGCTIKTQNDIYIAPAAEFATTKDHPDFVILENSLVRVSSVPNRGRVIFEFVHKPSGNSVLYTNTKPMPLTTDKGYFLEFGGYYALYPWDPRDNQPYDLEYEKVKETPEECAVRVYKKGLEFGVDFEGLVTVKKDASVQVQIKLTNVTDRDKAMDFSDRMVVSLGEQTGKEAMVVLPQEVREVTIGRSGDGWMGSESQTIQWPQPWQKWGQFKDEGHFVADLTVARERTVKVYDPESKQFFVEEWSPASPYRKVEISAWGPAYEDKLGAYPGFAIRNIAEGLSIPPGQSKTFEIRFYASKE